MSTRQSTIGRSIPIILGTSRLTFLLSTRQGTSLALRLLDLESCALFTPGGLYGATHQAFTRPASIVAAALLLLEPVIFGALAATAAGHSLTALGGLLSRAFSPSGRGALDDLSMA